MITINNLGKCPEFTRNIKDEEKLDPDIGNFSKDFIPFNHRITRLDGNGFFYISCFPDIEGSECPLKFPIDSAHVVEWNR